MLKIDYISKVYLWQSISTVWWYMFIVESQVFIQQVLETSLEYGQLYAD